MEYKVCKFGGSSLADRMRMEKVCDIIAKDEKRKYIVVSAPGKRNSLDEKVTDTLIKTYELPSAENKEKVMSRFYDIAPEFKEDLEIIEKELEKRIYMQNLDALKAFGEYASGIIFSKIMNKKGIESVFIDPYENGFVAKNVDGINRPDKSCYESFGKNIIEKSRGKIAIIPGFYARGEKGEIVTLPRGGSDTTGAVVANAVNASVYENWTDEDGLKRADPRIVPEAKTIKELTFREARELAYMGFKLQEESMLPVYEKDIPINIRNTNNPEEEGTFIVSERCVSPGEIICGIACKKPYLSMNLTKMLMNSEIGFGRKLFEILEKNNISYEHCPSGIDSMSVLIHQDYFKKPCVLNDLKKEIVSRLNIDTFDVEHNFALISVVGIGMQYCPDVYTRIFSSLKNANVDIRMLNEGAKDLSIFIGVNEEHSNIAVRAIYNEFFK